MTGDDAWALVSAILGTTEHSVDADELHLGDIVMMIGRLREEQEHLRNQLAAARAQVQVITAKRAYGVNPWLRNDMQTLQRLLAEHLPTWQDELLAQREGR